MNEENGQVREAAVSTETPERSGEECEVCSQEMYGVHCKLVCPNCGYRRDCSGP